MYRVDWWCLGCVGCILVGLLLSNDHLILAGGFAGVIGKLGELQE